MNIDATKSGRGFSMHQPDGANAGQTQTKSRIFWLALGLIVVASFVFLPLMVNNYVLAGVILAVVFLFPCLGLNIIFGYTGMLSFAQGAFFGVGAYASAIMSTRFGLPFWVGLPIAIILTGGLAALLAIPALRLSRFSFVMVTLGFVLIAQTTAGNWVSVTQGHMGLTGIPKPSISLGDTTYTFGSIPQYYYLCLGLAAIGIAAAYAVLASPLGRCFRAVRDDELLAAAYGMPVKVIKTIAFSLSAAFAAVGGAIEVHYLSLASPYVFDMYYTTAFLVVILAGGRGAFWAIPTATLLFVVVSQTFSVSPEKQLVLMGFVLIFVVFWLPNGFGPLFAGWAKRVQERFATWK